ncbi:MAG: ATP-binding protein, partial [Bacteroidetes bacterium]|nr:ATP-binding protein [Bacteroidota bacterium]
GYNLIGSTKIEFFVQDTGIGISADQYDKIFNRFYQIDLSTKRIYGGSGIGLSLANDFAEMLGSKIKVESIVGTGSRFSFILPIETGSNHLRIV